MVAQRMGLVESRHFIELPQINFPQRKGTRKVWVENLRK
jgi:hypothetical protein